MNESRPVIAKINIVARNFAETLKFYRLLGLEIPNAMDQPPGVLHAEAEVVGGMEFAIDNEVLARIYNAGWRTNAGNTSVLLTASLGSREEVDATFERLVSAGYRAHQPPYNAFWGARYAIVCDPEGNDVGLMSPIDPAFQSWPPVDSPAK